MNATRRPGLGEAIVLLTITTLDGQEPQVPFGWSVLKELHSASGEALAHLAKEMEARLP
jgi:hypothetical protein